MKACCLCDEPLHVCAPDVDAGLPRLTRQISGFPEYRLAMLHDIPLYLPLTDWRAREGGDLGIMLLEMWAYVLDILGLYDERIANESYLRTAVLSPSLRKLVELIGYQPRPALAASVILATIADGHRGLTLPPRTGFRSDAFDGEPPQVFETEKEFIIHPLKNEWTVAALRERFVGSELLLPLDKTALAAGQVVVFRAGTSLHAGRVASIETISARDGNNYKKLVVAPDPALSPRTTLDSVEVLSPVRVAAVGSFSNSRPAFELGTLGGVLTNAALSFRATTSGTALAANTRSTRLAFARRTLVLDAVYSELSESDAIVVQRGDALHAATITAIETIDVTVNPGTESIPAGRLPATQITITPAIPAAWSADPRRLTINFKMNTAGRLTRIAKTEVNAADFAAPGLALEGVLEPIPDDVAKPGELLLLDAHDEGALANGSVDINRRGEGKVFLSSSTLPFDKALRTPVTVFGNLVEATRGESVLNETLGSGDSAQAFQSFTLGKHPLTYINASAALNGRRSTLQVRVNGILWTEASSFFGAGPGSEIYTVRQNDDGESIVRFGDGITGSRLPTGVDNVTADYRFGAGAAKPPAGAIGQIAKPVEGLRRVVNPVAPGGGADADQPKDIRRNAPNSALILGRAVSVPDFEALAREFGGVINAQAEWAWDETRQTAVVKVTFISDGGDIAAAMRAFLIGFADPNTPLVAIEARPQPSRLTIDAEVDAGFNSDRVANDIVQALTNPESGLLAKENIPIGRPLFRSRIFEAVLSVAGTRSVRAMTVDGQPAPFAITVAEERYRDVLDGLSVEGSK